MHYEKSRIIGVGNETNFCGDPDSYILLGSRHHFENVRLSWMSSNFGHSSRSTRPMIVQQLEETTESLLFVRESVQDHVPITRGGLQISHPVRYPFMEIRRQKMRRLVPVHAVAINE